VPNLTDFTVTFGSNAGSDVDVRVATRPSGEAVDWGGDARISLPGAGRTIPLFLSRGEAAVQKIAPLDGDAQTIAGYGTQVVLAWPTTTSTVGILAINPDRTVLERPPDFGTAVSKVRIASRPSNDFTSELYAATWIQESAKPIIKTEFRTLKPNDPRAKEKPIGTIVRATDLHVACARRELTPPIVTATLVDDRAIVHTHDEFGVTTGGPLESPSLERVNRIVGIAVTPESTVTLAVNGNGSRLVQLDTKTGATVHTEPITGQAVSLSLNGDGTRLFVASVQGVGADAKLLIESFSVRKPTRTGTGASVVAPFPFVPGVPASRVSLASCAIAWPELRRDGSNLTDVYFQELDDDGRPEGEPHLANVSSVDHHYAPTVVCLSPIRAFLTMFTAPTTNSSQGSLALRRLPTGQR
jgi:hypothetical protein